MANRKGSATLRGQQSPRSGLVLWKWNAVFAQQFFKLQGTLQIKLEFLSHGEKTSMDSRSASCRMSRSISISQGGLERLRGQLAILLTAFGLGRFQTVAFPHGDVALNQDLIGVVDDTVHDCLGYRTSGVGIGVNTGIPALRLVLGAEDHGSLATCLHNLQQIIGCTATRKNP